MSTRRLRRCAVVAVVLALLAAVVPAVSSPERAEAAVASQFDPGMIISDALFFDGSAMDAGAVQSFLNSQVTSCRAGYTCLKDYRQDTPSKAAAAGRCEAYSGGAQETAATIIAKVGQACGISQKALLVLLQKEQSLVTDTWPLASQYRSATGYGCPDTAACDSTYYGFFNQVYMAALQFKRYAASPTSWNHIAGRYNYIRFHPNSACGSSEVLIQNQATAGLYNYTPYQPNAAALGNLYGTGDGCSSYGNRNFWRIYTDWFGSTSVSSLVRTVDNPGVFLVSGDYKYRVPNMTIFAALSPLGPLNYVSQSYLDGLTTAVQDVGRILRSPDGAIFFIDSAIKLAFADCQTVADYGGSCAPTGYVNVTAAQAAKFHPGPTMMSVMGTREGVRYYVSGGVKHEILDDASHTAAGLPYGFPILTESAMSAIPLAAPIVRDAVFVTPRGGGAASFLDGSLRYAVSSEDNAILGVAARTAGQLKPESINLIATGAMPFTGAITAPGSDEVQVISSDGRVTLEVPQPQDVPAIAVSQAAVDLWPQAGTLSAGSFIKSPTVATIYVTTQASIRPIVSWPTLVRLAGSSPIYFTTLPTSVVGQLTRGSPAIAPGALYRTTDNAQVFVVDGLENMIRLTSFEISDAVGFTGLSIVPAEQIAGYQITSTLLTFGVRCGTTDYIAADGTLHPLTAETKALFPVSFTTLDPLTCDGLSYGAPPSNLVRISSGGIYLLVEGEKWYVSAARFAELSTGQGWMQIPDGLAALIPTGPAA